jgi:hypothetical protein
VTKFWGKFTQREKMTAISIRFNIIIPILGFLSLFTPLLYGQSSQLSESDRKWIAEKIFANECSSEIRCLTSWNQGEDFPSLGIGHFIWYPEGQNGIYTESFPALLKFYQQTGIALPKELSTLIQEGSPWSSREQFYAEFEQTQLTAIRNFLQNTMPTQAAFILQRQESALPKLLANSPHNEREQIAELFYAIAASSPPYGSYALIDYVNFKGEGISASERYNHQGWGLLQVLQEMLNDELSAPLLERFTLAAGSVLERRVKNAPIDRNENRWLAGWLVRINSYLPPTHSGQ